MRTVSGGAYPIELSGIGTFVDQNDNSRTITVQTQEALRIFQRFAVREQDFNNDQLGLYSILNVGRDMKARFGNFTPMYSPWRGRKNGCTWSPSGKIRFNIDSIDTCPIEYDGEECPDAWWGDCMERIFNGGTGVHDLLGTPEGRAIVEEMLRAVYIGLGNGYSELIYGANHPLLAEVNTSGKYAADAERWAAYYTQQTDTTCSGLLTLLDALHDQGVKHHNLMIASGDVNADGKFTGDVLALFNKVRDNASSELREMARNGIGSSGTGARRFPILMASNSIYNAYKDYLHATYTHNPEVFEYRLRGTTSTFQMPGVLYFEGMPVVNWSQVTQFDEMVGTQSHRVAIVAPGTFGVAAQVDDIRQFQGMGLQVQQRLDLPYKGKVFMHTTTRWGTGLADAKLVSQAQYVKKPV